MPRLSLPCPLILAFGFLVAMVALAGCPPASAGVDRETTQDLARTAGDDIARVAFAVEDLATGAGALTEEGARETAEECYATVGDCTLCYALDGGYLAGTFTAETTPTGCGAAWSIRNAAATYAVTTSTLAGSWSAESLAGDYAIAMSGTREASLTTTTSDGTTTRDASWALDGLTATTTDFALASVAFDLVYSGFGDRVWTASVSGDAAGPTGAITVAGDRVTCSIGGTWESPAVSCL